MAKKKPGKKIAAPVEKKRENPRRAIFALSPSLFLSLFSGEHHYRIVDNPLPADATVIDVRFAQWQTPPAFEVLIEHPSIPELIEGQPVPYIKPPTATAMEKNPAPQKKK